MANENFAMKTVQTIRSLRTDKSLLTSLLPVSAMWQYAICGATEIWMNEINMRNNFDLAHGTLEISTPVFILFFLKPYSLKVQSICMKLCITLTCWPHLSGNLKSTFIQMCSARWGLALHNPSKCSIWREGLELFESSESSLACGEAADIRGELLKVFTQGTQKSENLLIYMAWNHLADELRRFLSTWPCLSLLCF